MSKLEEKARATVKKKNTRRRSCEYLYAVLLLSEFMCKQHMHVIVVATTTNNIHLKQDNNNKNNNNKNKERVLTN